MLYGEPIFYLCPYCEKLSKMETYRSYTVHHCEVYSDGYSTGKPHFTPDFAKCPHCKKMFFRHNAKDAKKVGTKKIKDIQDPNRKDLIKAMKQGDTKTWQEEKQLLEELWRDFNHNSGKKHIYFTKLELETYKNICDQLLLLTKKAQKGKGIKSSDSDNLQIQVSELHRNLSEFDNCVKAINKLKNDWDWLKKQFIWECEARNPFTFELISKREMELENTPVTNPQATCHDYFERGKKYLSNSSGRKDQQKALNDFNKAEELGINNYHFFHDRGKLYLNELNNPEKALNDFTKAIEHAKNYTTIHMGHTLSAFHHRSKAYLQIDNCKAALEDINTAISFNCETEKELYYTRKTIHEQMGNKIATEYDKFKIEFLTFLQKCGDIYYINENGFPPFYKEVTVHAKGNKIIFTISNLEGEPCQPEILYSDEGNILLHRNPFQFILLKAFKPNDFKQALKCDKVEIMENDGDCCIEYTAKVRQILEPLNYVKDIALDGYPFLTALRAIIHAHKNKPIASIIPKEDLPILACILIREEDYLQLERYTAEGLPLCADTPSYFRSFQPYPLYYLTLKLIWGQMSDPVKMLHWLIEHGANINQHARGAQNSETPLGNQCYANGNIQIMKALLEAGADPNIETQRQFEYQEPITILSNVVNFESNPDLSPKNKKELREVYTLEDLERMKEMIKLLKKHGAKEKKDTIEFETPILELFCPECETTNYIYSDMQPPFHCNTCGAELELPEPDTDGQHEGYD